MLIQRQKLCNNAVQQWQITSVDTTDAIAPQVIVTALCTK